MWGISQFLLSFHLFSSTQALLSYDYMCVPQTHNISNLTNSNSIIGGGTAGLTIASRLSENPDTTVLVLEAGNDHSNDTNVLSPGLATIMYGDPEYDWNYETVPQVNNPHPTLQFFADEKCRYTQITNK
jgi:hypothetical protein